MVLETWYFYIVVEHILPYHPKHTNPHQHMRDSYLYHLPNSKQLELDRHRLLFIISRLNFHNAILRETLFVRGLIESFPWLFVHVLDLRIFQFDPPKFGDRRKVDRIQCSGLTKKIQHDAMYKLAHLHYKSLIDHGNTNRYILLPVRYYQTT